MTSPAENGFSMPAEWATHARCWMAWPCRAATFANGLPAARAAYAAVARAVARFEPVAMVARPEDAAEAARACGAGVEVVALPIDDSWTRDTGPTFVTDGHGGLAGVDWIHNGWGGKMADHLEDAQLARRVLERLGVRRIAADLVLEGGAIHTDGEGTLITTESVVLNDNRNPGLTKADAEAAFAAWLGIRRVVWLGAGLAGDTTDGHVDNLACFVRPGVVVALASDDRADANHAVLRDNLDRLRAASDARGRALEVVTMAQPAARHADGERLALSYVNYYLPNGAVVMPAFGDPMDAPARDTLAGLFPDRALVQLPALDILRGGGGIHCITQQQPAT